jgi:N-acyl-D-amino-acid deacylase
MTAAPSRTFDLIIGGGTMYDGNGGDGRVADVGVVGDRIAEIGDLGGSQAGDIIDAAGMAVAPGFINVLSHSYITMLHDGRSLGELKQGVTTQIFGEGYSMGPIRPETQGWLQKWEPDLTYEVSWLGLREYLEAAEGAGLAKRGVVHRGDNAADVRGEGGETARSRRTRWETRSLIRTRWRRARSVSGRR